MCSTEQEERRTAGGAAGGVKMEVEAAPCDGRVGFMLDCTDRERDQVIDDVTQTFR